MKPINILVVGTGMYVCGKGTEGYGTVMPAILEWKKAHDIGTVYVIGRSPESIKAAKTRMKELGRKMGVRLELKYFPKGKADPLSYKRAIREAAKPACAIVAVPDSLHREIAGVAIEEGLHVLVVKPLAPAVKEVRELIKILT